jgi:hypothetical protein
MSQVVRYKRKRRWFTVLLIKIHDASFCWYFFPIFEKKNGDPHPWKGSHLTPSVGGCGAIKDLTQVVWAMFVVWAIITLHSGHL